MKTLAELDKWIVTNRPDLYARIADTDLEGSFSILNEATGLEIAYCAVSHELDSPVWAAYLHALKAQTPCPLPIEMVEEPEYPPEVHNHRPISADACMVAIHALCEGAR